LINEVKIDKFIGGDLYPDIALNKVNVTSSLNGVIVAPKSGPFFVLEHFEKQDTGTGSCHQGLVIDEVHGP
jgi:hypothetical protein